MERDFFRDLERVESQPAPRSGDRRGSGFEKHLKLIDELNHAMGWVFDLDELLGVILSRVIELTGADRGCLMLKDPSGKLVTRIAQNAAGEPLLAAEFKVSETIVDEVLRTGEPKIVKNIVADAGYSSKRSVVDLKLGSVMCVPLQAVGAQRFSRQDESRSTGLIYVDSGTASVGFKDEDLSLFRLLASQAGFAIENVTLHRERLQGQRVQMENEFLRKLSRRQAEETRVIAALNKTLNERTQELLSTTLFLNSILESSTDYAIVATDRSGSITAWNTGAAIIYGYDRNEAVQKLRLQSLAEPGGEEVLERALSTGRFHGEFARRTKDGRQIPVDVAITVLKDASGSPAGFVEISREITRQKEQERRLIFSEKMAGIGTLASGVAHEFNNLLQGVTGYLALALEVQTDPKDWRESMEVALAGAYRASALTQELQSFARPSKGERESLALADLCDVTLKLVEKTMTSEGIKIVRRYQRHVQRTVGDRNRLGQVLLNLVTNGRHSMARAGEKVLTVEVGGEDEYVWFKVSDTGTGIPPENLSRIFEPFFTTKGSLGGDVHDGKLHGTGLGLAISTTIVEEHGGRIDVESRLGAGTTFTVFLPAAPDAPAAESAKPPEPARPHASGLRILVVDDEPVVRDLLKDVLSCHGHAVALASDGDEGLRRLREETFDVLIADQRMPLLTGVELLAAIPGLPEERRPRARILISGHLEPSEVQAASGLGVVGVLFKPFRPDELLRAVDGAAAIVSGGPAPAAGKAAPGLPSAASKS